MDEAMTLLENVEDGVLKIIVTRGSGGRGYAAPHEINTTRVLARFPLPEYSFDFWNDGVAVKTCETRLGVNPALAGIKHLNRLEQILARAELENSKCQEGLMLDTDNNVIEGTMSNLFCVKNGDLITPDLSRCGVKGVIREEVIKIAREVGLDPNETVFPLEVLYHSDEVFICNSVIGIWPVHQVDAQKFNIGPISHQISQKLSIQRRGVEYVA